MRLQEWHFTSERFKEIAREQGFKVDEFKHDLNALFRNALPNARVALEKEVRQRKLEVPLPEETKLEMNKKKSQEDKFFNERAFAYFVLTEIMKELDKIAFETHEKREALKKAADALRDYKKEKEEKGKDQQEHIVAATIKDKQERDLEKAREAEFERYKTELEAKINHWRDKLNILRARRQFLKKARETLFKDYGQQLAEKMAHVKGKDGKPLFEGCTQEQIENFSTAALRIFHDSERKVKQELNVLDIRERIVKQDIISIEMEINNTRNNESLQKQGEVISIAYQGFKKISPLQRQLSDKKKELDIISHERGLIISNQREDKLRDLHEKGLELGVSEQALAAIPEIEEMMNQSNTCVEALQALEENANESDNIQDLEDQFNEEADEELEFLRMMKEDGLDTTNEINEINRLKEENIRSKQDLEKKSVHALH